MATRLIAITTGPAFGQLRTLTEQLEASVLLTKPTVSDYDLWRVNFELTKLVRGKR